MNKVKIAVIGAGQRGKDVYANYLLNSEYGKVVAVIEPDKVRREEMRTKHQIQDEMVFEQIEDFYKLGKVCDAVIIATMDQDHFHKTMDALELGYDILLEKPISPNPKECVLIEEKAKEKKCSVLVCHVLRYTPFYSKIKEIIASKKLGKVLTIQHNENIGNFHMAHSFVRGNWRKKDESSPIILQKSCHDMDILAWLVDSSTKKISSFGELTYFKEENAPLHSSDRCLSCSVAEECRFDAKKAYLPVMGGWPATVVTPDQSREGILQALETSPYGRCVYRCDNDVCDHQVTIIEFENGVTATFNLTAFTNKMCRTIKIMCEHGEIRGDDSKNEIEVIHFASNQEEEAKSEVIIPDYLVGFHGGGDTGLMNDFVAMLTETSGELRSSIEKSIESHLMSFAAEESRVTHRTILMKDFRQEVTK